MCVCECCGKKMYCQDGFSTPTPVGSWFLCNACAYAVNDFLEKRKELKTAPRKKAAAK